MLAEARSRIVRYSPAEAATAPDLLLVDIRSADERARAGAAASLVELGVEAGDLVGGYDAWIAGR
jgi:hypothetical protein